MAQANIVRIIGGKWRGRKVSFANVPGLRPSPDRVRETLFNWLQWEVQDAKVLEPYAGSGILSLEALSRGAAAATVIDSSRRVTEHLAGIATELKADGLDVRQGEARDVMATLPGPFDLVFLDPPFDGDELARVLATLCRPGLLAADAVIYLESGQPPSGFELPPGYAITREKRAGQVHFGLARPE